MSNVPVVSFLVPTLNEGVNIERCLRSIKSLSYDPSKIEIIIADGGSKDQTLKIAKKYNSIIINNSKRIAEYGKKLAFDNSTGDYIVFLDADNEITSENWLNEMLEPFTQPEVTGVESNYFIADNFSPINIYANLLVIVDPLARMLASQPYKEDHSKEGYFLKYYKKGSNPVAGANGFIWRRGVLVNNTGTKDDQLNEVLLLDSVAKKHEVVIGNIPSAGIYHYYCTTFDDYVKKRKKIAGKHLNRSQAQTTWVEGRGFSKLLLSALYLGTIVGPFIEAVYNAVRTRRAEWMFHPLVSFVTIYLYLSIFLKTKVNHS